MKFATTDASGTPTAFFSDDIHGADIPTGATRITDEQWQELIDYPGLRKLVKGQVVSVQPGSIPQPEFTRLHKAELWRRLSEQEADILDASLAAAPTRLRRIFEAAGYLDVNDPDYPALRQGIEEALGLVRAAAVLKPDH